MQWDASKTEVTLAGNIYPSYANVWFSTNKYFYVTLFIIILLSLTVVAALIVLGFIIHMLLSCWFLCVIYTCYHLAKVRFFSRLLQNLVIYNVDYVVITVFIFMIVNSCSLLQNHFVSYSNYYYMTALAFLRMLLFIFYLYLGCTSQTSSTCFLFYFSIHNMFYNVCY